MVETFGSDAPMSSTYDIDVFYDSVIAAVTKLNYSDWNTDKRPQYSIGYLLRHPGTNEISSFTETVLVPSKKAGGKLFRILAAILDRAVGGLTIKDDRIDMDKLRGGCLSIKLHMAAGRYKVLLYAPRSKEKRSKFDLTAYQEPDWAKRLAWCPEGAQSDTPVDLEQELSRISALDTDVGDVIVDDVIVDSPGTPAASSPEPTPAPAPAPAAPTAPAASTEPKPSKRKKSSKEPTSSPPHPVQVPETEDIEIPADVSPRASVSPTSASEVEVDVNSILDLM